jgi:predicted phage terminase large subunit-like protein
VFGLYEGKHYLIDMHNVKLIYPSLRKLMVELYLHHKADCILIEDKSSGQSLIQELEKGIEYGSRIITLNVIKVKPDSSKTARLNACTPLLEAGNLIIAEDATWQYLFTQQLLAFPNDKHDDQVDAMTQYLNWKRGVVNIDTMGFFVGLDLGR